MKRIVRVLVGVLLNTAIFGVVAWITVVSTGVTNSMFESCVAAAALVGVLGNFLAGFYSVFPPAEVLPGAKTGRSLLSRMRPWVEPMQHASLGASIGFLGLMNSDTFLRGVFIVLGSAWIVRGINAALKRNDPGSLNDGERR